MGVKSLFMKLKYNNLEGIRMKITKDTQILMSFGMGCLGCPSAQMESIGQAAEIHGIDLEKLLEQLNQ